LTSYSLSLFNNSHLLQFTRGVTHLILLVSIIIYQFVFPLFIHLHLSLALYSLCTMALLLDGLYLFFNKENPYLDILLMIIEACILAIVFAFVGFVGLFFILSLIFLEILALSLIDWFLAIVFALVVSILLSLSVLWQGVSSYEDKKIFVVIVLGMLFMSLIAGQFVNYFWRKFKRKILQMEATLLHYKHQLDQYIPRYNILNSLNFSRKLKPALNTLVTSFVQIPNKESFPKHYEFHLKELQTFVNQYVNYLESEEYIFTPVYLPQFLDDLLQEMKSHKDRPINLKETLKYQSAVKYIECSGQHLKKAFIHIIVNAFQAFKQQTSPTIDIIVYEESHHMVVEFQDNGCGIEESDYKNLFDPLFSKKFSVGGVGLAYVLKTIQAHKGTVDILSSSQGTKVLVKLPLLKSSQSKLSLTA